MIRRGYKVFTHHLCSPIRGGTPLWDGTLPYALPVVPLDTSASECAPGWNYAGDVETALYIAGLWPTGRPSRVFAVEASADAIERGTKRRASTLTVVHEIPEEEITAAIRRQSRCFASHAARMADEQCAWWCALARPQRDVTAVTRGLTTALRTRGLDWRLKKYANASEARATWEARAAWIAVATWETRAAGETEAAPATREVRAAWEALAAWTAGAAWKAREEWTGGAVWKAREAWAAEAASEVWAARKVRIAWDAQVEWAAEATWKAKAAWEALTVCYAAINEWTTYSPEYLTAGLREAYEHGLGIAIPTGPKVLGWAMDER